MSSTRGKSKQKKSSLNIPKDKQNDSVFLLQNQNQILKLKTQQLNLKIKAMQTELRSYTESLQKNEYECETLRNKIKMSQFSDDLRLEQQKLAIEDKIALLKGNSDILQRKINHIRESTLLEESKFPEIAQEKKVMERELWQEKTKNEGLKVVLADLEEDLEKQRNHNEQLVAKKKTNYGPKQKQITDQIEERLRIMKNTKGKTDILRKRQGSESFYLLLNTMYLRREKESIMLIERGALRRKIMQKRVFLLSLIRRKYLDSVKSSALQKFRESFRPLVEQRKFEEIIRSTITRRIKNKMFRIWRSQAIKQQFNKTRYFQVQNTIQSLSQSFNMCNLFSAFNALKYYQNNPIKERQVQNIYQIVSNAYKRSLNFFISSLQTHRNNLLLNDEVEESAKEHSSLLVQALYFGAWAKLTKENKVSNRMVKFRYFRELKKLRKIKRKRELSEMLSLAHEKIKEIDLTSSTFCFLKKQKVYGLMDQLTQDLEVISNKNVDLEAKTQNFKAETKQLYQSLALFKISKHLKGRMDRAFTIWRGENRKIKKFILIFHLLSSKIYSWVNFGFAKIQRRRFQKLKLSIADKIESCEFSYNYLLQENRHIKEVLDNKVHQLQKSKFVNILHRLIRNQKQIKQKYFFKFMRSGYKVWKFKKMYQRADQIIELRTKVAAFFMFKYISVQKKEIEQLQTQIEKKVEKIQLRTLSLCFGVLENQRYKNKKIRSILDNVFSRNMELNVYVAYGQIKRSYNQAKIAEVQAINDKVLKEIQQTDGKGGNQQEIIQILESRLESKKKSIAMRKSLACRKFYLKNYTEKVLIFFNKWRSKVSYQNKIKKFAEILERKTRIIIKNKFAMNFFRNQKEKEYQELKDRLNTFKNQLNEEIREYDRFADQSEKKMKEMEEANVLHDQNSVILQKKTIKMDDIKISSFRRYWGKVMCSFVLRDWRQQKVQFIQTWKKAYEGIRMAALRYNFQILSEEMKEQILKNRLKKNLSKIYSKTYRYNAGLAFNIWRITNINKKIEIYKGEFDQQSELYQRVTSKCKQMDIEYDRLVNYRIGDRKCRKIFDFLKKYTRLKLQNNRKKKKLETWLRRGHQIDFMHAFLPVFSAQIAKNRKADQLYNSKPQQKFQQLFYTLKQRVRRRKTFRHLFIDKFIHYSILEKYQEFFTKTKNYYRENEFLAKDRKTFCIQKVIETFEKKRKKIIGDNIRRWRKNQFEMKMGRDLFRRLTRKAFCSRYEGMFYAWKLEAQARKVLAYHHNQGQIKKRKVEIQRLEKFIQDMKKKKGLLLENEDGNFVVSPRFQKKKEEEDKKEKNLRYKFVSRLILSMNGYAAPIRAYTNLQVYMKLRQRYRDKALFVLNHLRKPDMLLAFRTWRKATTEFRQLFETMERKQLIKLLNKQKDKMEMEYSHKLSVDQQTKDQLERYRVYTHQKEKQEKICGYVLMKHANKVKQNAFRSWREKANQLKNQEMENLADQGYNRLSSLEEQLNQLEEIEREYKESNSFLQQAVNDALSIAEMVKKITEERDRLSVLITEKNLTCESLLEENQVLNSRLYLAQKEAMNLLIISSEKP